MTLFNLINFNFYFININNEMFDKDSLDYNIFKSNL